MNSAPNTARRPAKLSDNALEILTPLSVAGQCARIAQPRRAPSSLFARQSAYRAASPPARNFSAAYPKALQSTVRPRCTKRCRRLRNANFILRKLQENRWENMTQTARARSALERSHLYRKMKSLGNRRPRTKFMTTPAAKPQPNHSAPDSSPSSAARNAGKSTLLLNRLVGQKNRPSSTSKPADHSQIASRASSHTPDGPNRFQSIRPAFTKAKNRA